jgi:pimeloyl-ACP methyl ester carboxylesterase
VNAPLISVNGSSIYHEMQGAGEPLLLLHGGFCSIETMRPQMDALASQYSVYAPERPGHGRSPDVTGPFSYKQSVADTLAYLDHVGVERAHVVGFSDGAIIGLTMAIHYPDRVSSLVAISGNLHPSAFSFDELPDGDAVEHNTAADAPHDRTRQLYDELSPDGPEHAAIILEKLEHLWTTEPNIDPAELSAIAVPTRVMAGDRDVVKPEHSRLMASSIPAGELCIVPGAGHDLLERRPDFVTFAIQDFLATSASASQSQRG